MDLTTLIVLGNALVLGVRHGIDWDHLAAIADIVGTSSSPKVEDGAISLSQSYDGMRLSLCYALGHAAIVLVLGVAALQFAAVLPAWIDPLMEKAVGITLLLLGAWVIYSVSRSVVEKDDFVMQSRWMYLFSNLRRLMSRIKSKVLCEHENSERSVHAHSFAGSAAESDSTRDNDSTRSYSAATAFGIGTIHGFGAETGTQVLLIAAVGGSSTHTLGVMILLSFITGLLLSNTFVAMLTCAGFANSARFKSLFVVISFVTGLFSLAIGAVFVGGRADLLPDLQRQ